jgi:hypothetical protein
MPDRFAKIKEAVEARDQFLKDHPEYSWLQDKIDEELKKAGNNQHNRQVVLQKMMLDTWFKITEVIL